ncbi:hypothetical protein ACIHAR_30975 [Streptomyces sp. NPDC052016]|uniref:hypothetical protein n=1 Tax=Streptomyces sp. NPDC052016 TaxID=3365680 RepID=UPI0037D46860
MPTLPRDRLDLLERPLRVHPAAVRPDGTPRSDLMGARPITALTERYGRERNGALPGDAPDRIAIVVRPLHTGGQ